MKTTRLFILAGALVLASCTHDVTDPSNGKLSVVDWATQLATAEQPDTIQDKFDIVTDTDDPAAFTGVVQIAKDQAAATAAAGD